MTKEKPLFAIGTSNHLRESRKAGVYNYTRY